MKVIGLNKTVIISDPGQLTGQIQVTNVLPGNYRVNAKVVNGPHGKEVSLLGILHEDYFKQPKKWNWLMGSYLKTETGRVGIFSKETYQKDSYFETFIEDGIGWFQRLCKDIFKSEEKWECYHHGVALLVGPDKNDFCVYAAKNEQKQVVGFIIDFYVEPQEDDLFLREFGFHMELKEFEF